MAERCISPSEAGTLFRCQAQHAFRYTGALTGGACLKTHSPRDVLTDGRAWGAGVAHWHENGDIAEAVRELEFQFFNDVHEAYVTGGVVMDRVAAHDRVDRLAELLVDYERRTTRIHGFHAPEFEMRAAVRTRAGRRSPKWRVQAFADGLAKLDGETFIVEFKLRSSLSDFAAVEMNRQVRWEAWAWQEMTGERVAGVIFDERLNSTPSRVRFNKDGSVSKQQSCGAPEYRIACMAIGQDPDEDVLQRLSVKRWNERHYLFFTPDEIENAGREIHSASQLIGLLESGALHPVRNADGRNCGGCEFREVCTDPSEVELLAPFERVPPKRFRTKHS